MECAGLILDNSPHYIDHLAPFCSLMQWPLIVCENEIANTIRQYYPDVEVVQSDYWDLTLPSCIVSCQTRPMLGAILGPFRPYTGRLIWLPHGLSDKGWKNPFFEALQTEDLLLVYGQKMRDVLVQKKVHIPQLSIGNFRLQYYEQHRSFYNAFFPRRHILYAPTWEDVDSNGTFWEAYPQLASLPSLLVKLHPNTERRYPFELSSIPRTHFPSIYPLLAHADAYIGDMSSIGYDFLRFNRPLYFIRREKTDPHLDPSAFLMRAGKQLHLNEIDQIVSGFTDHSSLYSHAFDSTDNWQERLRSWLR
jgi:hypothetical protein